MIKKLSVAFSKHILALKPKVKHPLFFSLPSSLVSPKKVQKCYMHKNKFFPNIVKVASKRIMLHTLLTPNKTDDYNYNHVKTGGCFLLFFSVVKR